MKLRYQSLLALMEENGFIRKSFQGLLNDYYKNAAGILEQFLNSVEGYETLALMKNPERIDDKMFIWIGKNGPKMVQRKEVYNEDEMWFICKATGLDMERIKEVARSTT